MNDRHINSHRIDDRSAGSAYGDDGRFDQLRQLLLKAGVDTRTIRRAVVELASHFDLLVSEALNRGTPVREARAAAHAAIGSNQLLLERYAARPELRAWCCRRPALYFTLLPTGAYLALSAATMGMLLLTVQAMSRQLHASHIAPAVSHLITMMAHWLFLGVFPSAVGTAFAILACRRSVALCWPLIGIAVLGVFASVLNVEVVLTGGPQPGYAGAGLGLSTEFLAEPVTRAIAVILFAYALVWLTLQRLGHGRFKRGPGDELT